MNMCQSFCRLGHQVTLVSKRSRQHQEQGVEDIFGFYGVAPDFELVSVPRPAVPAGSLLYLANVRRLLRERKRKVDLVYARDPAAGLLAAREGIPVVFEAHGIPAGWISRLMYRRLLDSPQLEQLVVISHALRRILGETGVVPDGLPLLVEHDAAQPIAEPTSSGERPACFKSERAELQIGYVGHLYRGRGISLIEELAKSFPDLEFHLVGGTPGDVARRERHAKAANLRFHGFVPPARLSDLYAAFDILLMPYQDKVIVAGGKTDTSSWMSPLKLFEYMAAGKAIVSSNLPVLREVLRDQENALLANPTDVAAWRSALERLRSSPELRQRLGATARREFLEKHTWDRRARAVLAGIELKDRK